MVTFAERRDYPRAEGDFEWLLMLQLDDGGGRVVTDIKNISRSGLLCSVDTSYEKGDQIKASLLLPNYTRSDTTFHKINAESTVVRCMPEEAEEGGHELALRFCDMSKYDSRRIAKYVSHIRNRTIRRRRRRKKK